MTNLLIADASFDEAKEFIIQMQELFAKKSQYVPLTSDLDLLGFN